MEILLAALCGFALDLLLADPPQIPHPVVIMGKCISLLEKLLRRLFPKTDRGAFAAGVVLAALLPLGTLAVTLTALWLCGLVHPALRFAVECIWCWQALAMKGLRDESRNVYHKLTTDTLDSARKAVSRIVGRDTEALSAEGVTKAAVETVAENFSDGVAAPMIYMLIGGAPLALCYKSINTMDSMVGYKNDRYLYFGRAAAKLDDAANYLPSRLAALILAAAAGLTGQNAREGLRIWKRDRRNHASPNSAQTEAVMAGALGVQLAGPATYFGKRYEKPTIGDPNRPVEPEDILRANRMLYAAGTLCMLLCGVIRLAAVLLF
ncbi:MAG: adenosylcobinamide-phosphate synthase CbiB [Oscillospiraceae bacterium]|nr:adenosylcobinamide-phosphate synthase CbiB [Oscillospiraceae bacterium]